MGGKLVRLTVYYSVMEAQICVSMLKAHGIYAFAPTELAGNAGHMMVALGGIPVMVVESDLEAAASLIEHVRKAEEATPAPRSLWRTMLDGLTGLVVLAFTGVPPAPRPPASGKLRDDEGGHDR